MNRQAEGYPSRRLLLLRIWRPTAVRSIGTGTLVQRIRCGDTREVTAHCKVWSVQHFFFFEKVYIDFDLGR